MAVQIHEGGGLDFVASLDIESFQNGIQTIINGYQQAAQKAAESVEKQNASLSGLGDPLQAQLKGVDDSIASLLANLKKVGSDPALESLITKYGDLMKQQITFKDSLSKAIDPVQVQSLNQQLTDTEAKMKSVTDQMQQLQKASIPTPEAVPDVSKIIGANVLSQLKQSFGDIDQTTQKFIQSMIDLEIRLQKLQVAQQDLSNAYAQGKVSEEDYAKTSAYMVAETKNITDETQKLTQNQKEYEASLRGTTGSINEKKQQLASLKQAYENLSEAERNSAKGQDLNTKIGSLTQEIAGLKTAGNSIVSIRTELTQLRDQMARNPDSPLFDSWKQKATELQIEFTKVRKEIEEGINPSAGLEAFARGLRGIIGGFEAATGVIGLATDNQEDFEKVTKNAASALALMNGIQEISNVVSKTSSLNIYLLGLMHKSNAEATALDATATEAATAVAVENTVATGAQTAATEAATVATRGLTAALLSNPAALVVAAIAAIAGAYLLLRDNAKMAKDSSELLADANKKVNDTYAEKLSKVLPLLEAVKEGNVSEQKSIQIHEQLATIDEKLVAGLDRKRIAYDALKLNVDAYADSLRNQYRLEANSSAIQASIKNEEDISAKLKESKDLVDKFNKTLSTQLINSGTAATITLRDKNLADVAYYTAQLKEQRATTEDLVKANVDLTKSTSDVNTKRGTDAIDKDIAALRKEQAQLAQNSAEWKSYQSRIDALQKERDAITGKQETATTGEKEYNKALREQLSLLQTIDTLQRGAKQSGLIDEESEIDKINQKYDDALKKIEQFNKTAPKKLQIDASSLDAARATELKNATFKKNADEYKKTLDIQKGYFEDYEKAKLEFGEEKAKQLFAAQIAGANSYLEFLKQQKAEIEKAIPDGQKPNFQQALELQNLNKQITDENNREQKAAIDKRLEDLKTLLKATVTFNEEKQKINKKYDDLEKAAIADTTSSPEEIANRLRIIKGLREQDLTDLQNNLLRQSDLYKKLNEDITFTTREELKKRISDFKKVLADPKTVLSPEMKAAIKSEMENLSKLLHDTDPASEKALKLANDFNAAANGLSAISSTLKGVDDSLSETVGIMSDLANAVGTTLKSLDTLKNSDTTADKIGAVTGIVSAVTTVISSTINFFKEAKDSAKRSKQELKDYNDSLITGQISYNELLRQQQLTQTNINDLTVKELQTRRDILATQKLQAQADYNALLKQIELQGQQITGEHSVKYGGIFGIGRKTKVVQDLADLSDTDYDNLLKLFTEGKLDASTAKWFQELQKVHDELDSIGTSATEVQDQINQQLTGTTASSITDSIIQGFADGKRATADFADDFQKLMQQAVLNSLKENALAVPLQKFYKQFAEAAQSDDILTAAEIASLKDSYNATITAAGKQFDELQKITKVNFNSTSSNDNALSGVIKGITEQTGQLLAGQFGGLRITAFDQLSVARNQLTALNQIVFNTSLIATTNEILRKIDTYGLKIK